MVMKHLHTLIFVLLNALFCVAFLWFFSRNAIIRPYLGSEFKELMTGILLLSILYANYFVLYPKLYKTHVLLYWISVVASSLVAGGIELAVGFSFISECNAPIINKFGSLSFFSKLMFLVFGRNIAFNFIPFVLRNIQQFKKEADNRTRAVYERTQLLDVYNSEKNCQLISVDNIYYCVKDGNYVRIYDTLKNDFFTRYCSLKYLEQLVGNKEFVRVSNSTLIPFKHIASCNEREVVLKKMPWVKEPLTFKLDTNKNIKIATLIAEHLREENERAALENISDMSEPLQDTKNPSIPPQPKLDAVYSYIQLHPGSRSTEITAHIKFSLSTVERCLLELKKQGLIEYVGSKKTGGYRVKDGENRK